MDIRVYKGFNLFNTNFIMGDWIWVERNNSNIAIEGILIDAQCSFIAVREGEFGRLNYIKNNEIKHLAFSDRYAKQTLKNRKHYKLYIGEIENDG